MPASVLRELESSRGEVLTEAEYQSARTEYLESLERPRLFEKAVVLPGALFFLAGLPVVFAGIRKGGADPGGAAEAVFIGCLLSALGALVVIGHLVVMKRQCGRATTDRLADLDCLLREGLIPEDEFERLRSALLRNSGPE